MGEFGIDLFHSHESELVEHLKQQVNIQQGQYFSLRQFGKRKL